jgi:hypothetical protein
MNFLKSELLDFLEPANPQKLKMRVRLRRNFGAVVTWCVQRIISPPQVHHPLQTGSFLFAIVFEIRYFHFLFGD